LSDILKSLYDRAPAFAQNLLLSAYSYRLDRQRYGGEYARYYDFLTRSQRFSREELLEYQGEKLRELVAHAYSTVPYYRELFDSINLKPTDIRGTEDLHKIPLLRKEEFKDNPQRLMSTKYDPRDLVKGHTSGTTGSPLDVWYDKAGIYIAYAALARHYDWAGCRLARDGDRVAVARGNMIVPVQVRKPPYWRYNWYHNQLLLSTFHMSPGTLDYYFNELERFRPSVLDGYPSTLYVLAKHLQNSGRKFPLRAAITSSETLFDFQRETIEESFECRVFDYYALAERSAFAGECEHHFKRHLAMEYAVAEVTDDKGEPLPAGTEGLLVGTSLHNKGMPLIRYVTNDRTAILPEACPCGRALELMEEVTTKAEDTITLRDGRLISPSVLTHPFKPLHTIRESQIVQTDYDRVLVKVVKGEGYSDSDTNHLVTELADRLGQNVEIVVEFPDALDRTSSGKFRWVVSNVTLGI
jgi:phenylacetate-CoA ligase